MREAEAPNNRDTQSLFHDRQLSSSAINAASLSSALATGAADACLDYLRRADPDKPDIAEWNCRVAEMLYHDGRQPEAVECGERAFAVAAGLPHILDFCAWLFSNSERHDLAAQAYHGLISQRPDWIEGYRHLSGSLAACGDIDAAIDYAARASDLLPSHPEYALHAGRLLAGAGRFPEVIAYLGRGVAAAGDEPAMWRDLADLARRCGRLAEATDLALRATEMAPDDAETAIHAAEMLIVAGRYDQAATVLQRSAPATDPAVFRVLSAIEMLRGDPVAALAAIDRALTFAPDIAEYWLHRAHLLLRLNRAEEAAEAVDNAANLDPDSPAVRRADLDILLAHGEVTVATALAGELLRDFPQEEQAAEAARRVLERRLEVIDGEYAIIGEARTVARHPSRAAPTIWQRLQTQRRVVQALIIRETRTRFGDSRLGYGWALIEPMLHLLLLSGVFSILMHGTPPIGTQFFVFYYTGLVPYHLIVHSSGAMAHAITANAALLQLPVVTSFDVILARGLLEVATDIVVAVLLLFGLAALGLAGMPDDLWNVSLSVIAAAAFGCGVGFINAVLTVFHRSWDKIFAQLTRALYFCSGIFYVPAMMPDWARDILAWNPALQAVDWFRAGFFGNYQPHWLDRSYLAAIALFTALAGLGLQRVLRRRLSEPL